MTREQSEHMMAAFKEVYGPITDCKTKRDRDAWHTWLGTFVLGYQAALEFNATTEKVE